MHRWLFIDTRSRDTATFGWLDDQGRLTSYPVVPGTPGLVSGLAKKIKQSDMGEARGICVVAGPGSFSSIRMGTLVANLLARIHGLPLYGVEAQDAEDPSSLVRSLAQRRPSEYVAPVYDREPNITCPSV